MESFRTFIAIPLESGTQKRLGQLIKKVAQPSDGIKWVPPDNLHLTLKFLGDVDNVQIPAVCDCVAEICESIEPFAVTMSGAGGLPSAERARVLAVLMDDHEQQLQRLVTGLENGFADLGFKRESRDYVPHLTLGRTRGGSRRASAEVLESFVEAGKSLHETMEFSEAHVVSSFLEKGGANYQVLDRIAFG